MKGSIKNKIIISFVTTLTVIICVYVFVVSWQLHQKTAEQADLLAQELTSQVYDTVGGYHAVTISLLDSLLEGVERYGLSLTRHSPIAATIVRQQQESIVEFLQISAVKEAIDFTLIFNVNGELQASSGGSRGYRPGDRNLPAHLDQYHFLTVANTVDAILQDELQFRITPQESAAREKKSALHGLVRLDHAFLKNLGVDQSKIADKGAIALVAAGIVRDDFYIPAGIVVVGKLLNGLNKPFQSFSDATSVATVLYMDTAPIAFAGFNSGENEAVDPAELVISPDLALAISLENQPTKSVMTLAGDRYISTCTPLQDMDQTPAGILCTSLPEKQIVAIQQSLLHHGMSTQKGIQKWLVAIGAVMILIFIILARIIATSITRPLEQVVAFTMKVGEGKVFHRLHTTSGDEIGTLSRSIDAMLDNLAVAQQRNEKLEDRLRLAKKMEAIGTLAGGIAHEFNNILYAMLGYTDLAREDVPEGSSTRTHLDHVLQAGERARKLVQQILTFSHQREEDLEPVKVDAVLLEVVAWLRTTIPSSIEVSQDIQTVNRSVLADAAMIHQLVVNLFTNAVQAMSGKGLIAISAKAIERAVDDTTVLAALHPGEYIEITVSDNGPGIEPEIIDRLFDPFFTTKEVGQGTGMGLAVVHGIVDTLGGLITVESELGKGASFHVYLPVMAEESLS